MTDKMNENTEIFDKQHKICYTASSRFGIVYKNSVLNDQTKENFRKHRQSIKTEYLEVKPVSCDPKIRDWFFIYCFLSEQYHDIFCSNPYFLLSALLEGAAG